jgi:DNA-binding CsgD family transcriptional regulator
LETLVEERLRLQYEAEIAYLRGDFEKTLRCFTKTEGDDAARLRVCPVAVPAAISAGDYRVYSEIDAYLKKCAAAHAGGAAALAELARATAAVSAIAPLLVPEWLAEGDFSALAPQTRPNALYLRAKYLQCLGNHDAMLATAQAALALSEQEGKITTTDIYLRVTCAVAYHELGQQEKAARWLLDAMAGALPNGFITPFVEVVTALGGLAEQCLKQAYPAHYGTVLNQWTRTWKNWISFHNRFTRDNITLILTLREYHIALLAARRVPYADIAKKQGVSVGRLKNIMQEIYGKLCISGRSELSKYVL